MTLMEKLVVDIDRWQTTWVANPAARMDFFKLLERVLDAPSHDHCDEPLRSWIAEEKASLRELGIR